MDKLSNELKSATNVYRTCCYIVKQVMSVSMNKDEINSVCSYDTYYKRSHTLDKEYEKLFKSRKYLDGKRLPSNMYTRIYKG